MDIAVAVQFYVKGFRRERFSFTNGEVGDAAANRYMTMNLPKGITTLRSRNDDLTFCVMTRDALDVLAADIRRRRAEKAIDEAEATLHFSKKHNSWMAEHGKFAEFEVGLANLRNELPCAENLYSVAAWAREINRSVQLAVVTDVRDHIERLLKGSADYLPGHQNFCRRWREIGELKLDTGKKIADVRKLYLALRREVVEKMKLAQRSPEWSEPSRGFDESASRWKAVNRSARRAVSRGQR